MKRYLKFIIPIVLILFLLIPVKVYPGPFESPCPGEECFWDPVGIRAPIGVFLLERIFNTELEFLYLEKGII